MATTAQLNTRMDSKLKAAGDRVLSQAGISPTKLIRLVWSKVAAGSSDLQQLLQVLQTDASSTADQRESPTANSHDLPTPSSTRTTPTALGPAIFSEGLSRLGISNEAAVAAARSASGSDWKDLREDAIFDRLQQRGIV